MNEYHRQQSDAVAMVCDHLAILSPAALGRLKARIRDYLVFRKEVDSFLRRHFSRICTQACYQTHHSACCNREGVTTFFADVVINLLMSPREEIDRLLYVLSMPNVGTKCVYLGAAGCLWRFKPIVCEMFLCKHARETVFDKEPETLQAWEGLKDRRKGFTWPSRPVLFDDLERYFMEKGYDSSLMYFHNSPGLLRVKAQAGLRS